MNEYHIEEIADRPASWQEIKWFRRTRELDQIHCFLVKLSQCSYERKFRVYWNHGPAKEAIMEVITKGGQILSIMDVFDQRKEIEKERDMLHWFKRHRDVKFGFDKVHSALSKWTLKQSENVREGLLPKTLESYVPQLRITSRKFGN
jgi:hypothetical protein